MTATAAQVAAALRACYPTQDDHRKASSEELEAMRRQWGICVGAVAEALQAQGELPQSRRLEFYQGCGVEVYN